LCGPIGQAVIDLAVRADIEALLRRFYGRVMVDDVLRLCGTTPSMRCSGDPSAERAKIQGARIAWAMHRRLTGTDTPELDALIAR
jgi:hypothetical protein